MARYLISFNDGDMVIPEEDMPAVGEAAHAVIDEAMAAGVFVFGGGLMHHDEISVVSPDGTITDGPYPETKEHLGGLVVVDVPTREEALKWAAKIAEACRCPQEVFVLIPDPKVER
jgi:hypothetical protein